VGVVVQRRDKTLVKACEWVVCIGVRMLGHIGWWDRLARHNSNLMFAEANDGH